MNRREITFAQAEGHEPLPSQLETGVLTQELRALLWAPLYERIRSTHVSQGIWCLGAPWLSILRDAHVQHFHLMADKFEQNERAWTNALSSIFEEMDYVEVLGLLQFILRHPRCPSQFADEINMQLERGYAAYRVFDKDTIAPFTSEEEAKAFKNALAQTAANGFEGGLAHLKAAGANLSAGHFGASVRESVHAVESVARAIGGTNSLNDALARLETKAQIHKALKKGFGSIYGFTSDEKGIRHPLLDAGEANVDEVDALFMLGACASFVTYMIEKARRAGIL